MQSNIEPEDFDRIVSHYCKKRPETNKLINFSDGLSAVLTTYKTIKTPKQLYWRIQFFGGIQSIRVGVSQNIKLTRKIVKKLTMSDENLHRYLRKKLKNIPRKSDIMLYRDYYLNLLQSS